MLLRRWTLEEDAIKSSGGESYEPPFLCYKRCGGMLALIHVLHTRKSSRSSNNFLFATVSHMGTFYDKFLTPNLEM